MNFSRGISTLALATAGAFATPALATTLAPSTPVPCTITYTSGPNGQQTSVFTPPGCGSSPREPRDPPPRPSPNPNPQLPVINVPIVVSGGNPVANGGLSYSAATANAAGGTVADGAVRNTVNSSGGSVGAGAGSSTNDNSYSSSTVYRAAASTAMSAAGGTQGHGCFRGKGAFSLGLQAVGGGVSATIGGGEEYELVDMVVLNDKGVPVKDAEGKIVTQKVNPCVQDQITLATIYNGTNGTPAQRAMAATTAAAASPAASQGLNRVIVSPALVTLFGGTAPASEPATPVTGRGVGVGATPQQAVAPTTVNIFVDSTGKVVVPNVDCSKHLGTTPKFDATKREWVCQPG